MRFEQALPHLRITLAAPEGPVAEVIERDARQAMTSYPGMALASAIFGYAVEDDDGGWRLLYLRDEYPQMARTGLAQHFFLAAKDASDAGDDDTAAQYSAAEELLYRHDPDELSVAGARYRIVRAQPFLRMGDDGPEPPRPTDLDTPPPGEGVTWEQMRNVVIIPPPAVGPTGAALMIELAGGLVPVAGAASTEMRAEAKQATRTHPGIALLPNLFAIVEKPLGGGWQNTFSLERSPSEARERLARHFRPSFSAEELDRMPEELRRQVIEESEAHLAGEQARQAHEAAAQTLLHDHRNEIDVAGHRYRITRAEIAIRLGPDGPEPPRPTDPDPRYQPITDDDGQEG
ncbi:MAG TPA: DUF5954 family protein [Jiangellaceae bacterium]